MALQEVVRNWKERIGRRLGNRDQATPATRAEARLEQLGDAPLATPSIDVFENDVEILVRADVPGGAKDDAVVAWSDGNRLTFAVKNRSHPRGRVWASEYAPHDWYRVLELPDYADGAKATSMIKDGVLTIRVPKRTTAPTFIPVRAA
jgi:HSP20 family protein